MNTLRQEIENTVRWFAEVDIQNNGEVSESTKEAARVQEVNLDALFSHKPGISFNSARAMVETFIERGMAQSQCQAYAEYIYGISDVSKSQIINLFAKNNVIIAKF